MKFRIKPELNLPNITIDAIQFRPHDSHRTTLPDGVLGVPSVSADSWAYGGCKFYLDTPQGHIELMPGDYIMTGPDGAKRPCKPDIFEARYVPCE